ncbi:aspartyl-phosphate phosphatase Spo0E family protein [Clostridium sp. UBA1652]|nr:aspartyl-phosphate phosphatase Spo0E family protein [Clostridium sp. UBA1652]
MKELKEKLNAYVSKYGLLDPRTLEVSQQVDVLVVQAMRGGKIIEAR